MTEEFDPLHYDKGYYWTPSRETDTERLSPLAAWNGRDMNGKVVGVDEGRQPQMKTGYRFFSSQRQRLIMSILGAPEADGGAGIHLGRLKAQGWVQGFFPLHDKVMYNALHERWGQVWWNWWIVEDWKVFLQCFGSIGYIPGVNRDYLINDIRDYFGEQIALYFAFISMLTRCLIFPALIGVICYFIQTDPKRAGQKSLLAFVICLLIWSGIFIKLWTRMDHALSYDWDSVEGEVVGETIRPQFEPLMKTDGKGEPQLDLKHGFYTKRGWVDLESCKWADYPPEGVDPDKWEPPANPYADETVRHVMYCIDVPTILVCIVVMLAATAAVLLFRLWALNSMGTTGGGILAGFIQGATIYILNSLFEILAYTLADMENQRTQEAWEDSFICKLFGFQFLNTYTGMIYIAFIKYVGGFYDISVYGETDKCFPSVPDLNAYKASQVGLAVCEVSGSDPIVKTNYTSQMLSDGAVCYPVTTRSGNDWSICYAELQTALIGILLTKMVSDAVFDYFYPAIMNLINKKVDEEGEDDSSDLTLSSPRDLTTSGFVEDALDNYGLQIDLGTYDTTLYDYNQIILNWGFIVMFSGAWPLTPLVGMIYNIISMLVDQSKLMEHYQRPMYRTQTSIGVWKEILEYLSYIGIVVHTLMLTLTTDDFQQRGWGNKPMSKYEAFAMAVMLEHFVIFVRIFIEYFFDDIPSNVVKMQALDDLEEEVFYESSKKGNQEEMLHAFLENEGLQEAFERFRNKEKHVLEVITSMPSFGGQ